MIQNYFASEKDGIINQAQLIATFGMVSEIMAVFVWKKNRPKPFEVNKRRIKLFSWVDDHRYTQLMFTFILEFFFFTFPKVLLHNMKHDISQ